MKKIITRPQLRLGTRNEKKLKPIWEPDYGPLVGTGFGIRLGPPIGMGSETNKTSSILEFFFLI